MKKVVTMLLCCLMVAGSIFTGDGTITMAADNLMANPGFEKDIWGSEAGWTFAPDSWDGVSISQKQDAFKEGENSANYYSEGENRIKVSQWISLEPGTYQLKGYVNGELNVPSLYADVTDKKSNLTLKGWGNWVEGSLKFEVTEAKTVELGFDIACEAGGWGYIDDVSLTKLENQTPDVPEEPEYTGTKERVTVKKISGLSSDFMMGVDISSIIAEEEAGVVFCDREGKPEDPFKILKDAGVNWVRVRIWNNPFDSEGRSYGGGNNDLEVAKKIATRAAKYDLKLLVDFHYSDFWASPGVQDPPKAWKNKTVDEKVDLIYAFTLDSLKELKTCGAQIGMVQVGNETSANFCGEKDWTNICKMFNGGAKAVRKADPSIKVMIHFGGSKKKAYVGYAKTMKANKVDYDVMGVSWYTFYNHGSLDTLKEGLAEIADTYKKEVVVAEHSAPVRFDDSDGHPETFGDDRYLSNLSDIKWDVSVQGQATQVRDVIEAVSKVPNGKGIGYFYWEPAWITVGDTFEMTGAAWQKQHDSNQKLWEAYGCGWATSYSGDYYDDRSNADKYWGGSSWDNQAMFDNSGKAYDSLNVFKYCYTGSKGNANPMTSYQEEEVTLKLEDEFTEDDIWKAIWWNQIKVTYADGKSEWTPVRRWIDSECRSVIAAYNAKKDGTYTIHGIMRDDENSVVTMKIKIVAPVKGLEAIDSFKLSKTTYTYNGDAKKPSVTIKDKNGTTLVKDTDYTVKYASGRKSVGTYKVTITGIGNYDFTKKLSFKIVPKGTTIKSLTANVKQFTVTFKKQATQTTGYNIQYSTSSKFTASTTVSKKYKGHDTLKKTYKKLKAGKKYYVRIRTYKKVDGTNYYSSWSKVSTVKTK